LLASWRWCVEKEVIHAAGRLLLVCSCCVASLLVVSSRAGARRHITQEGWLWLRLRAAGWHAAKRVRWGTCTEAMCVQLGLMILLMALQARGQELHVLVTSLCTGDAIAQGYAIA